MSEDEILYGKRQTPAVMRALDRIALEVNTKIRQRGIAKGFVCTQEAFNKLLLEIQTLIYWASIEKNLDKRAKYIDAAIAKIQEVSVVMRYMLINKALTVGEIGVISKYKKDAVNQLYKWRNSVYEAMSGDR